MSAIWQHSLVALWSTRSLSLSLSPFPRIPSLSTWTRLTICQDAAGFQKPSGKLWNNYGSLRFSNGLQLRNPLRAQIEIRLLNLRGPGTGARPGCEPTCGGWEPGTRTLEDEIIIYPLAQSPCIHGYLNLYLTDLDRFLILAR